MLSLDLGMIRTEGKWTAESELRGILGNLQRELKEGPEGGKAFFMGKEPGRADILVEYQMSTIKHRNWVDLAKEFPMLDQWLQRCYDRPAFKRSLEKGNGYDLSVFPKVSGRL
jgi:glutathione S-transferase